MITKAQALAMRYRQTFHYGECKREIGPRGGVTDHVTTVRVSGQCRTWKTREGDFRLPIKHGLYDNGAVTQDNAQHFHMPAECPIVNRAKELDQALDSVCGEGTAAKMREGLS